jgi:hypothetical protein
MERHEYIHKSRKQIFLNNFLGGVAWGIGATVGVSIFFTLLGFILSKLDLVPFIGNFVLKVTTYVMQNNPHFR